MKVKARVPSVENAQQVGGFTVMHREDLERVAPRWLYWTEEVRQDPDSWANTGDIFNGNGKNGPPWISEMYGYVFACAEARVDFKVSNDVMLYPGYQPPKEPWPAVLHYGITYHVDEYAFDKHWYMGGGPRNDFTACPGQYRLRQTPGRNRRSSKTRAALNAGGKKSPWSSPGAVRRDEVVEQEHCGKELPDPPHRAFKCSTNRDTNVVSCKELRGGELSRAREDERARGLRGGARARGGGTMTRGGGGIIAGDGGEGEKQTACGDDAGDDCCGWARDGECEKNPGFMLVRCAKSCDACGDASAVRRGVLPAREEERGRRVRFHPREEKRRRRVRRRRVRRRRVRKSRRRGRGAGRRPGRARRRARSGGRFRFGGDDDARWSLARGWSPPAPVLAFGVGSLLTTVGVRLARGSGRARARRVFWGGGGGGGGGARRGPSSGRERETTVASEPNKPYERVAQKGEYSTTPPWRLRRHILIDSLVPRVALALLFSRSLLSAQTIVFQLIAHLPRGPRPDALGDALRVSRRELLPGDDEFDVAETPLAAASFSFTFAAAKAAASSSAIAPSSRASSSAVRA